MPLKKAITKTEIANHRMANQQMGGTKFKKPEEVVSYLVAMQAQEYAMSKWAIGLRLRGSVDDDVEAAFSKGAILRTHLMRPTWHFVTPADILWLLQLTAPRVNAISGYMYRKTELDNKIFKRSNDVIIKTLEGGKQLTREALKSALDKVKIVAEGHRLSYIMMRAELDGIICSGARQGKQFTYALLNEILQRNKIKKKPFHKDEALAGLTRRYFYSRGPATLKDFATWSGLSLAEVKSGLSFVNSHLVREKINNEDYYFASSGSINRTKIQKAFLLPIYDEYIMGYKNRSAIIDLKISPHPEFVFDQTIVIEGKIQGTWRRTFDKKSIVIECNFFKPLNRSYQKSFEMAVTRFSEFLNLPVAVKS